MTKFTLHSIRRFVPAVLCSSAILLLSACGGEGEPSADSRLNTTVPFSSKTDEARNGSQVSENGSSEAEINEPGANETSASPNTDDSGSDETIAESDEPQGTDESGSGSEQTAESDEPQGADESGSGSGQEEQGDSAVEAPALESASEVSGKVVLRWGIPSERENGDFINPEELDGYEIRYRAATEEEYQVIFIEDALDDKYYFSEELNGLYEFQIAVYDVNGLYSKFVSLVPYES